MIGHGHTMRMSEGVEATPGAPAGAMSLTGRSAGVVGVGMLGMNVLAYAFTLLAAHRLGPDAYGGVAALLGVIIVANVGSLTLQTTAARRLAVAAAGDRATVREELLDRGRLVAVGLGLLLTVLTPVLDLALHIHDWVTTLMVAPTTICLALMGVYAGVTQGERRWRELAAICLAMGVGRVTAGGLLLAVSSSARAALVGVAVGSLLPAAVGWWCCRGRAARDDGPATAQSRVLGELWRNGHTLLAFFVLTNLDVVLARTALSTHDSGIYSAGAIITKTGLFLPTFVLVVAFPSMAADRAARAWMRPLLAVLALGACEVGGVLALPHLAQTFVGGDRYAGLAHVTWLFAVEGTLFAALQIVAFEAIAAQAHVASVLWGGGVVFAAAGLVAVHSVTGLVVTAVLVAVAVSAVLAAALMRRSTSTGQADTPRAARRGLSG